MKDFYLALSEKPLTNALNFAKEIIYIGREDIQIQIMYHPRKSLLFSDEKPWMEREGKLFDKHGSIRRCRSLRIGKHIYAK